VDTVDHVDPEQLQLNAAMLAIWALTIANLPELLPRSGPTPPDPRNGGSGTAAASPVASPVVIGLSVAVAVAIMGLLGAGVFYGRKGRGPLARCFGGRPAYSKVDLLGSAYSNIATPGSKY
jgi:hypothetical protein